MASTATIKSGEPGLLCELDRFGEVGGSVVDMAGELAVIQGCLDRVVAALGLGLGAAAGGTVSVSGEEALGLLGEVETLSRRVAGVRTGVVGVIAATGQWRAQGASLASVIAHTLVVDPVAARKEVAAASLASALPVVGVALAMAGFLGRRWM